MPNEEIHFKHVNGKDVELYKKEILEFFGKIWKEFGRQLYRKSKSYHWKYFTHMYSNNPIKNKTKFTAIFKGKKMVGFLGYIPVVFKKGNKEVVGDWDVDFFLLPEMRGKGLGKKLIEQEYKNYDFSVAVGNTEASRSLYLKEGWNDLGFFIRFVKVINCKPYLPRLLRFEPIISCLNLFFARTKEPDGELEFIEVSKFDNEITYLWNKNKKYFDFVAKRTPEYLNWRFGNYINYLVKSGRATNGYFILKKEIVANKLTLKVIDIFLNPNDTNLMASVFRFVEDFAKKSKCDVVEIQILNGPISTILKRLRFFSGRVHSNALYVSKSRNALNTKCKKYLLTGYDSDNEVFYLNNFDKKRQLFFPF